MSNLETWVVEVFRQSWGDDFGALLGETPPKLLIPEAVPRTLAEGPPPDEAALTALVVGELSRFLWAHHQFLELQAGEQTVLARSVLRALRGLAQPSSAEAAMQRHRREVGDFVRERLGTAAREVTCAEYSPALQLSVLGIETKQLLPPVLDIGCGPGAALVRHLRTQGIDAEGLDRDAPPDVATRGDWLTHHYGRRAWGAVLSHQAFSLHFLHHHLKSGDTAYAYAHAYMAIVRALAVGGRFLYAPGLPFIEALLEPAVYRVHRLPFAEALRVPALVDAERDTGLSLSHAVHVERLA